jgi:cell division initiation protein
MAITPLDIRKKTFGGQLRGYSQTEVKAFLSLVANEVEELRKDRAQLAEKADELAAKLETYEKTEKLLRDTLVTAQKATGELRDDAKHEAGVIIEKAKVDADRQRLETAQEVNRMRAEADHEVARVREELSRLKAKRSNLIDEVAGMARTYLDMAERQRSRLPAGEDASEDSGKRTGSKGQD